jgi:Outer membrane protein beta-barrel domain
MAQENSYQLAFVSGGQTTNIQSIKSLTEINYFQIPLLFQFSFGKSLIRPYLKIGGTPAYILKSTRKDETATVSTTGGTTTNTTSSAEQDLVAQSNVDRFQGGGTVAAGLHLGRFIDLESRYDFTLTSLNNDVNSFYKGAKTQALGVQLGVRF